MPPPTAAGPKNTGTIFINTRKARDIFSPAQKFTVGNLKYINSVYSSRTRRFVDISRLFVKMILVNIV